MSRFKVKDHYFKKAKKDNFLARSIYKLEEIDNKYSIVEKNNDVLDLGYHPGSWVQYLIKKVGPNGFVSGIDIRPLNTGLSSVPNLELFEKDINDITSLNDLGRDKPYDVVTSDMAPNTMGVKSVDQLRSLNLVEMVFYHLPMFLKLEGHVVIKVFDSQDAQNFLKEQKSRFKEYNFLKPKSTRSVSKEFFVIGKYFLG